MLGLRLLGPRKEEACDRRYSSLRSHRSRRHASLWVASRLPALVTAAAAPRCFDCAPGAGDAQGGEPRDREPREWSCPALQPGVCSGTTIPRTPRGPLGAYSPHHTAWSLFVILCSPGDLTWWKTGGGGGGGRGGDRGTDS